MIKDGEGFKLRLEWKPRDDLMSKILLSNPKVINLVIHSLIGTALIAFTTYASSNNHTVVQTERTDGSLSGIVHASIEPLPPVLIEIQYQVSQDFML
ncbi:hypothetical protein A0J61_02382 [Choanephora cucurbitarum]|uniref:Uncharacterized protein n=1 Tax=Choanephora cucurbitarum TaxID=101091 RepID=A0A1C7NKM7_9FUNG|nr:hypothetical protein A0J61_02382 [Choanephora cucurbitarum]